MGWSVCGWCCRGGEGGEGKVRRGRFGVGSADEMRARIEQATRTTPPTREEMEERARARAGRERQEFAFVARVRAAEAEGGVDEWVEVEEGVRMRVRRRVG
jgi:hypothetical protein